MNWDALGAIAELIGATGVVSTLAYLSVQIRRSTAQARSDAYIKMNDVVREFSFRIADDQELGRLVLSAGKDWDSISTKDQFRVHIYNMQELSVYESYYFMMINGQIDEETYRTREEHIVRRLTAPGGRYWWDNFAYNVDVQFVNRINEQIKNQGSLPPMEDVEFFDPDNWEESDDA
ncbi:MAG: hypothetical protein AAF542_25990 [Pseudomonadota bacterium]